MSTSRKLFLLLLFFQSLLYSGEPFASVANLSAAGCDSRIDLKWAPGTESGLAGYRVYRSPSAQGPFSVLSRDPHEPPLYSDFIGKNDEAQYYRVSKLLKNGSESELSQIVSARSKAMSDDELLTSVQEAAFRYFWNYGHPVSGLARERTGSGNVCAVGGTGFGLAALVVGAERGFVTREEAAARILLMLTFLGEKADRFHGAWPHWLNGRTGKVLRFSEFDDGGDLVETAFLVQGFLIARQYFQGNGTAEAQIRERATALWKSVEWDWYLGPPGSKQLTWHWSPTFGWKKNLRIGGRFNESMLTYLLAIASPTHPIPPECYNEGWLKNMQGYANGNTYYGQKQWAGKPMGGPLFFTQYSFLGLDPRDKCDKCCNYFENNRAISLIQRSYCMDNPGHHKGFGALAWGLTSCDTPDGYRNNDPANNNGTLAPTAALSAMPYTPVESLAALKHLYHEYGSNLWGEFGFKDAFNPDRGWFSSSYVAIDEGPIVCMIENYRSGLCWKLFMSNPEIVPMLKASGWVLK